MKFSSRKITFIMLTFLALSAIALKLHTVTPVGSFNQQIFEQTNTYRVAHKATPLTENPILDAVAKDKAEDMLAKNYWAHNPPDGGYFSDFFSKENYMCGYIGENLARDFVDASSTMNAWEASPTHNSNLLGLDRLNSHFTEEGIYSVKLKTGYFTVVEFGGCS